jgi:Spy/CpxP family protein refolding chaperone
LRERRIRIVKTWGIVLLLMTLFTATCFGQTRSPAGQEKRTVKALSPEEIEQYLSGHGMGLAKAAELNHYPGPRHVLELSEDLGLTDMQRERTQEVYDTMRREAVRLGRIIIEREAALEACFAEETIDEADLRDMVLEVEGLKGTLRFTHLRAHLVVKDILTPEQIARYDALRGYAGEAEQHRRHSH